jgi:cell division septation protein DedD
MDGMARDWRSLALGTLAAAVLALSGVVVAQAQNSPSSPKAAKAAPKKAPEEAQQAADDDEPEELKPEAKPKRKKQDPVEAQRGIEAAAKLIEGGRAEQAVQSLTNIIAGGNLPPASMARALLYRGMAYRQQQKPAQAISDISAALWVKGGLSPADRASAQQQRTAAYHEAGLTETGEALPRKERASTGSTGTETAGSSESGGFWGNWFGGGGSSSSSSQTVQPKPDTAPFATTVKAAPAEPRPSTSSWSSGTEVRSAPAQTQAARTEAVETSALSPVRERETATLAPTRPEGRFSVQLAMVRSQNEATTLAAKIRRDYAAAFPSREPEIDQTVVGNMGSFYRVRVGPFATQNEGQQACAKLKGSGLDCMVVTE